MKTVKFYKIVVISLFILNGVTLFFLLNPSRFLHPGHPNKMDLLEQLELSGNKKEQIIRLQDAHFQAKDKLMNRNRTLHERLFHSFNDPKKDSSAIALLINDIVENQREIEQMTFDYFKKIDALCTPEQKVKLQNTIHKVLSRVGGPPPRK